jgi:hypothetical protein
MKLLNKPTASISAALVIGALVLTAGTAEARRRGGDDHHVSRHDHHRSGHVILVDQDRRYAYIDQFGNVVIVRGPRTHHKGKVRSSHHHHRGHHNHSGH